MSIRQPWPHLIKQGSKEIENSSWPTKYRGPFVVHASERQRPQINAVGDQKVEGDVGRTAAAKQRLVEQRAPSVIEHYKLTIEDVALRREVKHALETLYLAAVARDQAAANGVGRGPEPVKLGLKQPIGTVERLARLTRLIKYQHAGFCNRHRSSIPPARHRD
ncbi:MAG TPA: hypothetical protein VGJ20_23365 [Xanthobacteraceae bacterium]